MSRAWKQEGRISVPADLGREPAQNDRLARMSPAGFVPAVESSGYLGQNCRHGLPLGSPGFVVALLRGVGVGVVFPVAELANLLQRPLVAIGPFRWPRLASEHNAVLPA